MSNSERGRRTGQHEQKQQQASLTILATDSSVRIDASYERLSKLPPVSPDEWLRHIEMLKVFMSHPEMITITHFAVEDWRDRDEKRCEVCGTIHTCDECPECAENDLESHLRMVEEYE